MSETLLVGGIHDGQRIAVRHDVCTVVLSLLPEPGAVFEDVCSPINATTPTETYHQERTHSGTVIYRHESIAPSRLVDVLIDGYRRAKEKGGEA